MIWQWAVVGRYRTVPCDVQSVALTTLSTPAGAQLWASVLETADSVAGGGDSFIVNAFASALTNTYCGVWPLSGVASFAQSSIRRRVWERASRGVLAGSARETPTDRRVRGVMAPS